MKEVWLKCRYLIKLSFFITLQVLAVFLSYTERILFYQYLKALHQPLCQLINLL